MFDFLLVAATWIFRAVPNAPDGVSSLRMLRVIRVFRSLKVSGFETHGVGTRAPYATLHTPTYA